MSTSTLERPDIDVIESPEKGPECDMNEDGCTVAAVAMGKPFCMNIPVTLVCQNVMDMVKEAIKVGGLCGNCMKPIDQCWTLIPLA